MQKFLEDTIESRFIKALLFNSYLPTIKTVNNNDYIIKNFIYIYKKDIIKCTKTGYLWDMLYEDTAEFDIIDSYEFGEYYPKFTRNFISHNNYYDTSTHVALGHYLRCYRDIYNIDLMPFYNCYGGEYSSAFYISIKDGIISRSNMNYKVLMMPIKFNKTYTIAIDSPSQVIISAGYIYNKDLIQIEGESITDLLYKNLKDVTVSYSNLSFLSPITYTLDLSTVETEEAKQQLERYENNLYLLIQVPYGNTSSSVILEGDYTDVRSRKIFSMAYEIPGKAEQDPPITVSYMPSDIELNKLLLSNLSLLKFNDHEIHPFSDRLIEFLLNNVIDSNEVILKNIERTQNQVKYTEKYNPKLKVPDVWDAKLRKLLFDFYWLNSEIPYDITGYVDKDMERLLLRKTKG